MAELRKPDAPGLFTKVASERVSELIVDQIRLLIREGKLQAGDRLPSERDLCEHFGVSRVTVREALRMLEGIGLVDIRVGARGGAFLTAPTGESLGAGISDLLSLSDISAVDVTEARRVLEVGIVPLVCERADERDLADLKAICARSRTALRDGSYSMDLSVEFHVRVAAASHNSAVTMIIQSFREPLLLSLERSHRQHQMGEKGLAEHVAFVKAVQARDVATATATMRQHLARTARRVGARRQRGEPGPAC